MRVIIAAAMAIALAGCTAGASFQARPISTGGGPNALKRTPCAGNCGEVKQTPGLPDFLQETKVAA